MTPITHIDLITFLIILGGTQSILIRIKLDVALHQSRLVSRQNPPILNPKKNEPPHQND